MLLRRGLGSLVVVLLVVGGCSDDSDGGFADLAELMEELPEDGRTEEQRQADAAFAAQAQLVAADLPAGWAGEPQDDDDDPLPPGLLDCLGVPEDLRDELDDDEDEVSAESDEFSLEDASTSSNVYVYASDAHARTQFVFFDDPDFVGCFETALREQFEGQTADGDVPIEITDLSLELVDAPDVGDEAYGMRFELAVAAAGLEFRSVGDFVVFRVGRAVADLQFTNVGGVFDPALAEQLTGVVAGRMAGL
jgi:hypothetical protein